MKARGLLPLTSFLFLALLIYLTGSAIIGNSALDIHMHDTYVILDYDFIFTMVSFYFMLVAISYLVIWSKRPSRKLFYIHLVFSILGLIMIFYPYFNATPAELPRYTDFTAMDSIVTLGLLNKGIALGFILFILAQLTFVVNLVSSIFRTSWSSK